MLVRLSYFALFLVGSASTDVVEEHRKLPTSGLFQSLVSSFRQMDCACSEGNVLLDYLRREKVHCDCAMTDVCLLNDNLCGAAYYGASIQRERRIPLGRERDVAVTFDACVEFFDLEQSIINLGIPGVEVLLNRLDPTLPEVLCMEALRNAETGVECAASINNVPCQRCEVCDLGLTVSVDCSNIYPFFDFGCIGIREPVCDVFDNLLSSVGNVLLDFVRGEKVHFDCAMADVCFLNDNFCGAANYGASIQRDDKNGGIDVTLDACVEFFDLEQSIIDLGIPGTEFILNRLDPTLPEILCLEAFREAEAGAECVASINNVPCERCEVCESGLTVSVDCSNIYRFLNFECIGIQPPDEEPTSF